MHQFSFSSLKLQSKSTHGFCHFIKCTIRLFHHHRHKHHYYQKKFLATANCMSSLIIVINRAFGCQCHVAARYRLIWARHIATLCFAVDILRPFHWSSTNVQCLLSSQKEYVFTALNINTVAILKQTRWSLFTCVRGSRWHIDLITEVGWRKYDIRVTLQQCRRWPIVCFFLSLQTSL